jgi:DNA-binding XRE family transcriptional regulator
MFSFFGLGKPRSKFGKWLDRAGISQIDLAKKARISRTTISNLCNDEDYRPKFETVMKIKRALESFGHDISDDYFNM